MVGREAVKGLWVRLRQAAPIPLDVEFGCAPGELLALVGPSGSGKSTILRCIAGLHRPEAGAVRCDQAQWLDAAIGIDLPPQRRRIGIVFQQYALFPHRSALGNVMAALGGLSRQSRERRGRELLALVNLEGLESRRPAELSGGQQQRVALARALACDPAVLLLDEPFSAVDQVTRRKLQRELVRLRQQVNMPIVLVTHDLEEARLLADRMCILHRGQTLQSGAPEEVMNRPADARVARMVNLTNVFSGSVLSQQAGGETRLRWRSHTLTCHHQAGFAPGQAVDWVIPNQYIILHQRVRPSRGERENPVAGVIDDFVVLGDNASFTMQVGDDGDTPLSVTVPVHVARRNRLAAGERVAVSLLAEGIHLMQPRGEGPAIASGGGPDP